MEIDYKIENIKGKKYFVHVDTEEKWSIVKSIRKLHGSWTTYEESTCIAFDEVFAGFTSKERYIRNKYTEIPYDKFMKANTVNTSLGIYSQMKSALKKEDFLKTKIFVKDRETSIKVQQKLFDLGLQWQSGDRTPLTESGYFNTWYKISSMGIITATNSSDSNKTIFPKDLGIFEETGPEVTLWESVMKTTGVSYINYGVDPYQSSEIVIKKIEKKSVNKRIEINPIVFADFSIKQAKPKKVKRIEVSNYYL